MFNLNKFVNLVSGAVHSRKGRIMVMVITIALFVFSAGAPNAGIGIGK